jgi:hypothetical protein
MLFLLEYLKDPLEVQKRIKTEEEKKLGSLIDYQLKVRIPLVINESDYRQI